MQKIYECEYKKLIKNREVVKTLEKFDKKKDELDNLFMELCKKFECSDEFTDFVQRILVLFHENAAVERSFSYNKNFLVENLSEKSLIAQRSVHDFILNNNNGDIKNIEITKEMITAF